MRRLTDAGRDYVEMIQENLVTAQCSFNTNETYTATVSNGHGRSMSTCEPDFRFRNLPSCSPRGPGRGPAT